jgi:diacylglycerol kinase (ATP)
MTRRRRVRLVVNPSAHSGRAWKALARAGLVGGRSGDTALEWVESRSVEHLGDLVRGAQVDDLDALALAGGDGTVTLALGALPARNRVPVAVLPVGSGNDFARNIGVPRALPEAFALVRGGAPRWVDVGRVAPGGDRFCCVASLGMDEIALRIIHGSWFPRCRALHLYAAVRALLAYRPRPVRVTWQGGTFEGEVMFVAVTNTRSYGRDFLISPAARVDDGALDLCIVRHTGRLRLLRQFPRILRGTHGALPEVIQAVSPWVRLEGLEEQLPVSLDGELPRARTPVELRCEPRALQVLVPTE